MYLRYFLLLSAFILGAIVPLSAAEVCPVTTLPNPPFVPPAPYTPNSPQGTFWYGTNGLWAQLPVEGVWRLERHGSEGYFNKLFLWQQGYDWRKEIQPDIVLVLRRLNSEKRVSTSRGGTNAHFDGSWAMLTGIVFPTAGCWEVTATHDGYKLTFVLSIPPEQGGRP